MFEFTTSKLLVCVRAQWLWSSGSLAFVLRVIGRGDFSLIMAAGNTEKTKAIEEFCNDTNRDFTEKPVGL